MKCKMCLVEKKLCKAHIYPTFLYKRLRIYTPDKKGQSKVNKMEYSKDRAKTTSHSTGLYDSNILCSDCDNLISKLFENYAVNLLFDGVRKEIEYEIETADTHFRFSGIDSSKIKKFVLSVFWRASIADKFPEINLFEIDSEALRNILLNDLTISKSDFGVIISFLDIPEREFLTYIKKITKDGRTKYIFIAGGMVFAFYPNNTDCPAGKFIFLIDTNGEMIIRRYTRFESKAILSIFLFN
jgi:hypothetical protein